LRGHGKEKEIRCRGRGGDAILGGVPVSRAPVGGASLAAEPTGERDRTSRRVLSAEDGLRNSWKTAVPGW